MGGCGLLLGRGDPENSISIHLRLSGQYNNTEKVLTVYREYLYLRIENKTVYTFTGKENITFVTERLL